MDWKVGDWIVFDRSVAQIKELREDGCATVSDGHIETSGRLMDRFRPLTLKNKNIVETFDIYYNRLGGIDGSLGFNYPDISVHFSDLALKAIDHGDTGEFYTQAQQFFVEARNYKPTIQGVQLFRPQPRCTSHVYTE